jgi:acetyltransferase-like isoleucine patch superfamily enzyme
MEQLEDFALINAVNVVIHHAQVGLATTVGPNCTLADLASIAAFVLLGAGCTVLPDVIVGENAIIGAGALATRDVPAGVTVIGVPPEF